MSDWINHVAIAAPRNAATTHSVTPSSASVGTTSISTGVVAGAVVAGSLFTPTAGNFLACFPEGPVTSSTPTSWTLPTGGSAISITALYGWYRSSAAGGDTITTTHNGTNFPVIFDFYEFAAGTSFNKVIAATGVSRAGGAGPTLASLTGTNWIAAVMGVIQSSPGITGLSTAWSAGAKITDSFALKSGTDGYEFSLAEFNSDTSTSKSAAATITTTGGSPTDPVERLVFAVTPVVAAASRPRPVQVVRQAVNRAANF